MAQGAETAGAHPQRPPADWNRAADGVGMAGFAVFLLLCTTGVLPWSFWLEAIVLWPLLIMSAGVKIAFEKSGAPWLVLLGPAIVLGGLGWLASGSRPGLPLGPWQAEAVERPGGIDGLDVEASLLGARLHLAAADGVPAGRLVDGRSIRRSEEARLESDTDGSVARVRIRGRRGQVIFLPRASDHWDLRVPRDLPVRLVVKGAAIGARFDVTSGSLRGARAEGVFLGVEARLPAPGEDTQITMNGVFNSLRLVVPEGTPVRVHGPGLPFNAVDRGVRGAEGRAGYDVSVQGVFSAVDVRTDATISAEPPPGVRLPAEDPADPPSDAPTAERPPAEAPDPPR
jgi:hypothetical protein